MFDKNLKTLRKDRVLSQEQLAVRLNVVRQTISKWEKGLSVPDAEMTIKIAEVLDVTVSELLGKDIEVCEKDNSLDTIASELAKLNELLATQCEKSEKTKKKIMQIVIAVLIVIFVCSIYGQWNDMFYQFGRNLYYMFN